MLCEVCGKPVDMLADYADILSGKTFTPREYVEHTLKMSDEEKEHRKIFFEEMFAQHNAERQVTT